MHRIWLLVALLLVGCGTETLSTRAKPTRPPPTMAAAATVPTASPTVIPTIAVPVAPMIVPPTSVVPLVVTVIDNPVSVRDAASADGVVVATLTVGVELSVLGPDTTGPDGTTRWVHVAANGRDGYVRSDLVSPPHAFVAPPPDTGGCHTDSHTPHRCYETDARPCNDADGSGSGIPIRGLGIVAGGVGAGTRDGLWQPGTV